MRIPGTLLALTLTALSPSVRAAEEPDALAAAVHNPEQLRVLRDNGLRRAPDLRAYGLTLDANGVYRAAGNGATSGQLADALARWRAANHLEGFGSPAADAVVRHAERRRAVDAGLHDSAASLAGGVRDDDASAPAAQSALRREALRRSLLRRGAERLADGAAPPPEAGTPWAWAGWSGSRIDAALAALKDGNDAAIAARRGELVRLARNGNDPSERGIALHLLGRLHDETLLPVFLPALRSENDDESHEAAGAVSSIAAGYKAKESGWKTFLAKAPPLINAVLQVAHNWDYGTARLKTLDTDISMMNLMEEADVKRFLAGFDDPRALLTMISLGDTRQIGPETGIHSDGAVLMYARYRELSRDGDSTLGSFLEDSAMSQSTRKELLGRLNRYRLILPELKRDEVLRRDLPRFLFGKGSEVPSQTVFSIVRQAAGLNGVDFAKNAMDFIRASSEADARPAAAFLLLHPQMLNAAQAGELKTRFGGLDAEVRKALAEYGGSPPFYAHWPKGKTVDAALIMVEQEGQIQLFTQRLKSLGYAVEKDPGGILRFIQRGTNGEIRLTLFPFAANNAPKDIHRRGWAVDGDAVQAAVTARLSDPNYQVVIYRGHVGDEISYNDASPDGDEPKDDAPPRPRPSFIGKVFIDLACDSEEEASDIVENCTDCAFFGTNQTSEGIVNNAFLPEMLSALAARQSFAAMNDRLQARLPMTYSRFTGSWHPSKLWEKLSGR